MCLRNLQITVVLISSLICGLGVSPLPCRAAFHLWDIQEVYSNTDGSVQFIELFTSSNNQQFLLNHTLTSTSQLFTFPTDSPAPTANKNLLLATPGFAALDGGVVPDYEIPLNFFDPASDTLNFANFDIVNLSNAPTDGNMSLNYPGATVATNSPTNFAGDIGSLVPALNPADFDGDGDVDGDDLADWQAAYAATAAGDSDNDGNSDGADFLIWQRQFTGALPTPVAAIPEPANLPQLLIFLISLSELSYLQRVRAHWLLNSSPLPSATQQGTGCYNKLDSKPV